MVPLILHGMLNDFQGHELNININPEYDFRFMAWFMIPMVGFFMKSTNHKPTISGLLGTPPGMRSKDWKRFGGCVVDLRRWAMVGDSKGYAWYSLW